MERKIILSANETVTCHKCRHEFSLDLGIARHTIEHYEADFEKALATQRQELEETVGREAERKAAKLFNEQIERLTERLADSEKGATEAKNAIVKARDDAKAKAADEFAQERQAFATELTEKDRKLKEFREQEIELRRQKKEVEEQRANQELELQRKLDAELKKLSSEIGQREAERFGLVEADYKKKIEDAQKANEDLRRKLEQGSQQLHGEVLELELEHALAASFHHDQIEEVKKGQRGADVIHTVRTSNGEVCGKIIWEAKRAENWSDKWLTKLKDDQQEAQADFAVLVTTAMPKGVTEPLAMVGDVWLVAPHLVRPVAETLRVGLIEINKLRLVNTGRGEKMELLFNYLSSPTFAQKVRTVLESVEAMRHDLEAEKRAMQRIWAKRQGQIERVTNTMATVVGDINAIAHDAIPALDSIDQLALPASSEVDA